MSRQGSRRIRGFVRSGPLSLAVLMAGATAILAAEGPPRKSNPPTYTKEVLPILQRRCQNCHRRDQVGPFSLENYEQARKRASDIAAVAGDKSMPPWKPVAGGGPKLKHDPSLTPAEVAVLDAWAEGGAPRGEDRHAPAAAKFTEGWALGTPDLVLEMGEDFAVPASGPDLYRCFVIPTNLRRDVSISAVEF